MTDYNRRCDRRRQTPQERAIANALEEVEALGAHPSLTDVSVLLSDAQRKLADWHDGGRPGAY